MTTTRVFPARLGAPGYYPQYWECPQGVTSVTVDILGGSGGGTNGGAPGRLQGTLATIPGQVYEMHVAQMGQSGGLAGTPGGRGGYPNGGAGGAIGSQATFQSGFGGGGRSEIRLFGDPAINALAVAAGGGGAAGRSAAAGGLGGGTTGGSATGGTNVATGGTQTAGGQTLRGGSTVIAFGAGAQDQGGIGSGNSVFDGPGGGGDGWFGGAGGIFDTGGANNTGGGGGSNYVGVLTGVTNTQGYSALGLVNGYISLTYDLAPYATPFSPVKRSKVFQAASFLFQWIYNDPDNDNHATSDFRYRLKNTSAWTTVTSAVSSALASRSVISYTLTASLTLNAEYEWQCRSTNANGAVSPWSDSFYFTPANVPAQKPGLQTGAIELAIYDGNSGTFLDMIPTRIAPTYLDEVGNPGAGSFSIQLNDARVLVKRGLLRFRNLVRVKINNQWVGAWVIIKMEPKWIVAGEWSGMVIQVSGLGIRGGYIPDAVVYPEDKNNAQDSALILQNTTSAKRAFGFSSAAWLGNWFTNLQWRTPSFQSRQDSSTPWVSATTTGNPWATLPADWPAAHGSEQWIAWAETRGPSGDYNGFSYFRYEFTIGSDGSLVFYMAADDNSVAYLDGEQIITGNEYTTTKSAAIPLKMGLHVLTVELEQKYWTFAQQADPSGLLMTITVVAPLNAAGDLFGTGFVDWTVVGHPGSVPGWTIGDILTQLINEAKARGVDSYVTWINPNFNPWVDSYGFAWQFDGTQWQFGVGSSYDQVVDAIETINTDVWYDADTLELKAAPNRGLNRAILYQNDTYDNMVLRRYPFEYYNLATTPNGSSQWVWSSTKLCTAAHSGASNNIYGQAMPSPSKLTGLQMSLTKGTLNIGSLPASVTYAVEFSAAVPVGNTLITQFTQSGLTEFFSVDIQDAKDPATGATITGLQQVYFSFADDTNITGGLTGTIANFPVDTTTAHYVVQYHDDGASAWWEVWRNNNRIILQSVNPGHSLVSLNGTFSNFGRNFGDTPTAAVSVAGWAWYRRNLTTDEIRENYQATLGAFNPVTSPVIFSTGVNVIDAESSLEFQAKTSMIVQTTDVITEQHSPGNSLQKLGRIESFYDASSQNDTDAFTIAAATLKNLLGTLIGNTLQILDDYTPWRDFDPGDIVMAPPDQIHRINYAKDPSFEAQGATATLDTTLWHTGSPAVTMVPIALTGNALATAVDGGAYALRLGFPTCAASASFAGLGGVGSPVIPGHTYTISAWFYTTSGTKVKIVNGGVSFNTSGTNGVWEQCRLTFIASTVEPTIGVENAAAAVSGTDFVLMDCMLYEETPILGSYFGDLTPDVIVDPVSGWSSVDQIFAPGESFYQPQPRRVMSISVSEDPDTRKALYAVEVDSISQENDQRLSRWIGRIAPQGSLNGVIPNALLSQ